MCQVPLPAPAPAPAPAPQVVYASAVDASPQQQQMLPPAINPELGTPADGGYDPTAKGGGATVAPPEVVASPAPAPVAQPTVAQPTVILGGGTTCEMSGWLMKLGEVRKTWKRRWFTLTRGFVQYYDSDQPAKNSSLGSFQCSEVSAVFPIVDERPGGQSLFHVVTPSRTFILQASGGLLDQTRWIDSLRAAVHSTRHQCCQISVEQGSPTIKAESFVRFTLNLSVESVQCGTISGRYSELRAAHDQLSEGGIDLRQVEFPARTSWLTDDLDPSCIAERSAGLAAYYTQLLEGDSGGAVLCSPLVHRALSLGPAAVQQLLAVGTARSQAQQVAAAAAQQAAAAARAALIADQQYAQTVQQLPCVPGSAAPLLFSKAMRFQLKNKIFSFGDAQISGPGELPFFRVLRQDGILWSGILKNCQ